MKKLISTVSIAALVLIALARLCLYTVGEREYSGALRQTTRTASKRRLLR